MTPRPFRHPSEPPPRKPPEWVILPPRKPEPEPDPGK